MMTRREVFYGATAFCGLASKVSGQDDAFCTEVARIIALVRSIKPGQTRASLTEVWKPDGGINRIYSTRYKLKACESIMIDVEFERGSDTSFNDPSAIVLKVSSAFLQPPAYD